MYRDLVLFTYILTHPWKDYCYFFFYFAKEQALFESIKGLYSIYLIFSKDIEFSFSMSNQIEVGVHGKKCLSFTSP